MQTPLSQKRLDEARQLMNQSSFVQAMSILEKLTRSHPGNPQLWFDYGCAALGAGKMELAESFWRRSQELAPASVDLPLQMGHQYQNHRQWEKAREAFELASSKNPKAINPRMALVILFERNHKFAEAREAVDSILKIDPKDDQGRYFQAFLDRRENKLDVAEQRLRDLIGSHPQHQFVQYAARYELAEILDRTERFEEALKTLVEAKRLVRAVANVDSMLAAYDASSARVNRNTLGLPKDILRAWAKEFPERLREPIPRLAFLGGHPRSGTTLLEQILGAHPEVASLDESLSFDRTVIRAIADSNTVPPAKLNIIRRNYIQSLQSELGSPATGQLLLDKNPSPTARLRIWLRVFPELKVVIALRDPRDVILSCFFQNIPINPINANFLSLNRTVQHYENLMGIWLAVREWEGFSWIETRYEDTVSDLESEGRKVTEFIGLKWHEGQARFYDKSGKKRIYSPTYHDASQPVYKRSVARWNSYAKYLEPLMPKLAPYCKALGYEV
ncbi:MAG TPA: sulfotransferase [Verrucomicrobiae bacterium]